MRSLSYLLAACLLALQSGSQLSFGQEEAPAEPAAPAPAAAVAPAAPVAPVIMPAVVRSQGGALSSGESDYVLVVGDVVELNVFREPDLTTQATIARDGTVQLPLIREVTLAGYTIRDARELLRGLYDKQFLVDPQVFLNVVKYAERKFTIMGQVALQLRLATVTGPGGREDVPGPATWQPVDAAGNELPCACPGTFTRGAKRCRADIATSSNSPLPI